MGETVRVGGHDTETESKRFKTTTILSIITLLLVCVSIGIDLSDNKSDTEKRVLKSEENIHELDNKMENLEKTLQDIQRDKKDTLDSI